VGPLHMNRGELGRGYYSQGEENCPRSRSTERHGVSISEPVQAISMLQRSL